MTDRSIERTLSVLLRAGVLLSGLIVLAGGAYYLAAHGGEPANYRVFAGAAGGGSNHPPELWPAPSPGGHDR